MIMIMFPNCKARSLAIARSGSRTIVNLLDCNQLQGDMHRGEYGKSSGGAGVCECNLRAMRMRNLEGIVVFGVQEDRFFDRQENAGFEQFLCQAHCHVALLNIKCRAQPINCIAAEKSAISSSTKNEEGVRAEGP